MAHQRMTRAKASQLSHRCSIILKQGRQHWLEAISSSSRALQHTPQYVTTARLGDSDFYLSKTSLADRFALPLLLK